MQLEEIIRKIIFALIANPYLALIIFILLLSAIYLIYRLAHKPKIVKMLGEPVALDHSKFRPLEKPLYTNKYGGLTGKPDGIYALGNSFVPYEYKSSRIPDTGPREGHLMQLFANCLLCEEVYHNPVSCGVLQYSNTRPMKIEFTEVRRFHVLERIRIIKNIKCGVPPSVVAELWKCVRCAARSKCKYKRG